MQDSLPVGICVFKKVIKVAMVHLRLVRVVVVVVIVLVMWWW